MKKIFLLICIGLFLENVYADEKLITRNDLTKASDFIKKNEYLKAIKLLENLSNKFPDDINITIVYGTTLIKLKSYEEANKVFKKAINLSSSLTSEEDKKEYFSIYNTFGWLAFVRGNYYTAKERFKKALDDKIYKFLGKSSKGKLHNNLGYTYMLLEQYNESIIQFDESIKLGNKKAGKGKEKVKSILNVKKTDDINAIGSFAIVLKSSKNIFKKKEKKAINVNIEPIKLLEECKNLKTSMNLQTYKSSDNWYFLVLGSNFNYLKALELSKLINKNTLIKDSIVLSISTLELLVD